MEEGQPVVLKCDPPKGIPPLQIYWMTIGELSVALRACTTPARVTLGWMQWGSGIENCQLNVSISISVCRLHSAGLMSDFMCLHCVEFYITIAHRGY